jgi:hypothetical protein
MWILQDGRQFETQCASGTTFDVITCGCVLDQVQIVQPGKHMPEALTVSITYFDSCTSRV